MRRDAKASSAGSTQATGASRGLIRRAFVTRGARRGGSGSSAPTRGRRTSAQVIAALCVSVAALLLACVSPALGAQTRPFTGVSIGPGGAALPGNFSRLDSVFVDQASGDIYIYDAVTPNDGIKGKIYKFNAAGEPVKFSALGGNTIGGLRATYSGQSQIAVAPPGSPGGTAGDIYVSTYGEGGFNIYSPAGNKIGQVNAGIGATPCGVAVNPAGHVFISYYYFPGTGGSAVVEYTPSANPMTVADQTAASTGAVGCQVASDGLGNVYTASNNELVKREGGVTGSPVTLDPRGRGVAVDPASGEVFSNRGTTVAEFDSAGTPVGRFGADLLTGYGAELLSGRAFGIAVNGSSDKVYVATGPTGRVDVFGSQVLVPDVETEEATGIGPNGATLHGEIGAAGGPAASCEFQYLSRTSYEAEHFAGATSVSCSPPGPFTGSTPQTVSAALPGLTAGTSYVFRLVGKSVNGENPGEPFGFRTTDAVSLATAAPTNVTATSMRLNGSITPEGTPVEECTFEWGTGGNFPNSAPCAETLAEIGTGGEPKEVHADLTGLTAGTSYQYRLRAKNTFGTTQGGTVGSPTSGPFIDLEAVSGTATAATATACIITRQEETRFVVEYVTDADFAQNGYADAQSVPIGGKVVAEDPSCTVLQTQQVTGLTPSTKYHLRFAASSAAGTTYGEDIPFSTLRLTSAGLADGRAYEQVSPIAKNGGNIQGDEYNVLTASPSGDANTFYSATGAGDVEGTQQLPIYTSFRGASNWAAEGINPPASLGTRLRILAYRDDLSGTYSVSWDPRGPGTLNLRERGGNLVQIASGIEVSTTEAGTAAEHTSIVAESADQSRVLFESPAKLAPGAVEGLVESSEKSSMLNLYLWERASGKIALVSVLPDGSTPVEGATAGAYNWAFGGIGGVGGADAKYLVDDTLSRDGDVAVFTASDSHQIYARKGMLSGTPTTVHVSASQKTNGTGPGGTDPLGPLPVIYHGMTPDGRYIFFKSAEKLTNDAYTGPADEGEDEYRYDVSTGELIDIFPHPTGKGADVLGLAGFSSDGSVVYVVAKGVLATGGTAGEPNIYALVDGGAHFVSTLGHEQNDESNWFGTLYSGHVLPQKQARVTSDGQTLLFFSSVAPHGGIYRYELGTDKATCVSCSPSGFANRPFGGGSLLNIKSSFVAPQTYRSLSTRNLSSDGKRIVFQSKESLVSNDVNDVADVYEWEANGSGTCHGAEENGGCLFLISTGTSPDPSYFSGASASGDDVFFLTSQRLVGQDKDDLFDAYDARVGGGLAAQNPPPPNPCSGEACLGPAGGPAAAQSPGTANFSEPGNQKQVRKHKKHKKLKKHHKKNHGKSKAKHRRGGGHR